VKEHEILHAVNQLATFFNATKSPGPAVIDSWAPKLAMIPTEAISFVLNKIQDECDSIPRNLPKAFRDYYRQWRAANPQKETRLEGCPDCESGTLFLERVREDGAIETGTTLCAKCYQGVSAGNIGKAYLSDMETRGWRSTKAKTIGPGFFDITELRGKLSRARKQWDRPDPERRDYYEEAEEAELAW
jgi:hypothetical protein